MLNRLPPYQALSPTASFSLLLLILVASYIWVWLLADRPTVAGLFIALPVIAFLVYVRSRKLLVVTVMAALIGTLHEAFFASHGYWTYGVSSWYGVPAYLPSVWAIICMLSVAIYKGLLRVCGNWLPVARSLTRSAALSLTLVSFGLVFWSIWYAAANPWSVVMLFLMIEAVYLIIWRNYALALVGCFTFAAGMLADLLFVSLGVWSYPESSALWHGVPVYIFAYWHIMGVLLAGLYASLDCSSSQHHASTRGEEPCVLPDA